MKLHWFHLRAYPDLPEDFNETHRGLGRRRVPPL